MEEDRDVFSGAVNSQWILISTSRGVSEELMVSPLRRGTIIAGNEPVEETVRFFLVLITLS